MSVRHDNTKSDLALIVATAHKVGSTWLFKLLESIEYFKTTKIPEKLRPTINHKRIIMLEKPESFDFLMNLNSNFLFKSHSYPPDWHLSKNIRIVNVFRDPRDVIVSNVFYLANLSPELGGWEKLLNMSIKDRVKCYIHAAKYELVLFEEWFSYPHSIKIYYENLISDTLGEMKKLLYLLKIEISTKKLEMIIISNSFIKLSGGRKPGQEDQNSFFRKGISGDWKSIFDEELIDFFKKSHHGRWNKILVTMGYEKTLDW